MKKSLLIMLLCFSAVGFTQTKPAPKPAPKVVHPAKINKKILGAKATGPHSAILSWTASTTSSVTGYYVYQGTASGQESTTALNPTPVACCSYTVTGLTGLTTYYWNAKAYSPTATAPGLSVASNEATATTPADSAPNPPTGLSVGTVSENHVPLKWNAPTTQTGYVAIATEIFRGSQLGMTSPSLVGIVPASVTTYTDTCSKFPCYYEAKSDTIYEDTKFVLSAASNIVKAQ